MKSRFTPVVLLLASAAAFAALPAADTLPKNGDCPTSYQAKGSECVPLAQARFAIAKSEACPPEYDEQGNYCVATEKATLAIRRAAMSCPGGFTLIGNYCVSDK